MLPVCVKCNLSMRPFKNGTAVEVMSVEIGPYQLYSGDCYECPDCKTQVVVGFGRHPVAEHFQANYAVQIADWKPICRVFENVEHRERWRRLA